MAGFTMKKNCLKVFLNGKILRGISKQNNNTLKPNKKPS